MNQDRAKAAESALKNVDTLKKSLTKGDSAKAKIITAPVGPTKIQASGLPEPIAGTGFLQYIMYFIGGTLLLGIVLMIVDRWFFPIFKRAPGAPGYISLPGTDTSDNLWTDLKKINDISISVQPELTDTSTPPPNPPPLYSALLASQSTYTITLDVLINDANPQILGENISRIFFFIGTNLENTARKVTFSMNNSKNTVYLNVFDKSNSVKTGVIDNVPIHTPFRVGLVKTPYVLEAYLNGLLVKTVELNGQQNDPIINDIIYAPQNIKSPPSEIQKNKIQTVNTALTFLQTKKNEASVAKKAAMDAAKDARTTVSTANTTTAQNTAAASITAEEAVAAAELAVTVARAELTTASTQDKILSTGIQVMNLRLFSYAVQPDEMQARMSDLTLTTTFNPKNTATSNINTVSSWWQPFG